MTPTCEACGGKTAAPVCPHCGHRRASAAAGIGGAGLTRDEARALLAMSAPSGAGELRPIAAYLLPHPRTTGVGHSAETALTVLTAPLWALGLFGFAWARWRYRLGAQVPMGELRATLTIAGVGAPLLWLGAAWGLGATVAAGLVVAEVGAWLGRGVIRARADDRASALLSELDRPPPPPTLPTAVATTRAPAARPAAPALAPTAAAAPARVEAAPLEEGPRRLR